MRLAKLSLLAFVLASGAASSALAQDALRVRAPRRDTITAGATVTAVFIVSSSREDSVTVRPRLELPAEWSALTGITDIGIGPRSSGMLMVSLSIPARTMAGVYPVRLWVTSTADPRGVADSVLVRIPERRALDVALLDRPGYVVSGKSYDASFLVRNRGNLPTRVQLAIRGTLGTATIADSVLELGADESRVVKARVRTPAGMNAATDDILEISVHHADSRDRTLASARVSVVPEPSRGIEEYLKVPVRVNLRAANTDGVSPYEIFGSGLVRDGGSTQLDFLMRGPTGPFAAFGERDEYRVELRAPAWRARGGDQMFMLSSLTGSGQPGFGIGIDGDRGVVSAGAYGQHFRRASEKGSEGGGFLTARPFPDASVTLNIVDRAGGGLPGRIGSGVALLHRAGQDAELEMASSRSGATSGTARTARLSGALGRLSYDLGHVFADTGFAGSQRGASHNYLTANARPLEFLAFGLNGSMHRLDLSRSTGIPYMEQFNSGSISATAFDRFTLDLGGVSRETEIQAVKQIGTQRGIRFRADQDAPFVTLSLEIEGGRARDAMTPQRTFHDVYAGVRHAFSRLQVAGYGRRYSGGAITKGADGSLTFGGDAAMRVTRTTQLMLLGYATRLRSAMAEWHSQLDAVASHTMRNGTSVSVRTRIMGGGSLAPSEQSVVYVEYGMPMRMPVSRLRTPGRVVGRVVDAVTGQGVPGALVRLGPQVAITDKRGQVAFGGVPGGEHRLSMSQETSFANAVFVRDPTLLVDSTRVRPTSFSLAIARSARLDIDVRRFIVARTALAGNDSLSESGVVSNATLVLAGERDTLYRTTGDDGKAVFTDIPPGKWAISIRGDTPAFTRFDPDRMELVLEPGETRALTFRLVPRRRDVQIIGEGQVLRPTAADPKGATPAPGATKTVKPQHKD